MASTYSNLKIQLMGTGDNSGTWGDITNTNLGTAIEEAICESADVAFSQDSLTLSLTDANTTQTARHLRLNLTGTGSAGISLTVPDIEKNYIIKNALATDVIVKNSTGGTTTVKAGKSTLVYSTGSAVVDIIDSLSSLLVTGDTDVSNLSASGTFDVGGNASVGGTFAVTGDSDVSNLSASGTFDVGGNASVGGTLAVTGDSDVANLSASGTFDVGGNASVGGTLAVTNTITGSSTVSDQDGDLRDIPLSTKVSGNYTLAIGDAGNQVTVNSANVIITVPTSVFAVGDIISVISVNGCTATLACTAVNAVKAGDLAATALHTLDANGVASIMFSYTADLAVLTGNIS
jgi:hypothetical protein